MNVRCISAVIVLVAAWGTATAQSSQAPSIGGKTPSECLKSARDWNRSAQTAAMAKRRADSTFDFGSWYRENQAEAKRLSTACAAQFSIETVRPGDLPALAELYSSVGDTSSARKTLDRALAANGLTDRQRANAYLLKIDAEIRAADAFAGLVKPAEDLVRKIDAMPDSLGDLKLAAHRRLKGQYEYADNDDGIHVHAMAMLDLGRRQHDSSAVLSAYSSLIRTAGDLLHPDSALMYIAQAEKELGATTAVAQTLDRFRKMYALVGTKGTAIKGAHWLNAPDGLSALKIEKGKVWIVEFTAHWCKPCQNSYPGMTRVARHFANSPFETVLVTELYGFFEQQRPLSPAEELVADKKYFVDHHALPFKVSISDGRAAKAGGSPAQPSNDDRYGVMGIPHIVIIDKNGTIRQIVVGWDAGNEARFTKFIEQLMKEPAANN